MLGGSASTVPSTVFLYADSGSACGATAVTVRHVVTVDYCVGTTTTQILVGASPFSPTLTANASEVVTGPILATAGQDIHAVIVVADQDLPVVPAALAGADPEVDDVLLLVGYGSDGGTGGRTEGQIRVTGVDGGLFTATGEGGIEFCPGDASAYDLSHRLMGLPLYGGAGTGTCLDPVTYAAVSTFRAFVEDNLPAPAVDAGLTDDDGGAVGVDGAPGPDGGAGDDDGGGCCRVGADGSSSAVLALVVLIALVVRRRTSP